MYWLLSIQMDILIFFGVFVPTGSPSHGGDVAIYVFDIKQPSLPTPFYSVLVSCFCLYGPFNRTSFHEFSRQLFTFLLCFSGPTSTLLVLSTVYLFMKVSLSPDIILCGWLGLKYQQTNIHSRVEGFIATQPGLCTALLIFQEKLDWTLTFHQLNYLFFINSVSTQYYVDYYTTVDRQPFEMWFLPVLLLEL